MPKQKQHVLTVEQIARSFVKTIPKSMKKPLSLKQIQEAAWSLLLVNVHQGDRYRFEGDKAEACQPESIAKACKQLASWNKILVVNGDEYCLPDYAPKIRSLDDEWH